MYVYTKINKMRGWFQLLIAISASGLAHSSNSHGIMVLRVPEEELNRGVTHILDNHLVPYILDTYEFKDYAFEIGKTTRLYVDKIKIDTLGSVTTNVQLRPNNEVELSAQLSTFALSANFTLVTSETDRYPNSVIGIDNSALKVVVEIGTGAAGTDITLKSCNATFDTFHSNKEDLEKTLLGLIELGAKSTFAKLVEQVCPYLEDEAREALVDILKIEETFSIQDAGNKTLDIDLKIQYTETNRDLASVVTSVTKTGIPAPTVGRSGVSFPSGVGDRIELWMDAQLLELLTETAITEKVFSDTSYTTALGGNSYNAYVNVNSVEYAMDLSTDGVIFTTYASLTLDHIGQNENPCFTIDVDLDADAPVIITYNDRRVIVSPDLDRLHINFTITGLGGQCNTPSAGEAEELLEAYNEFFQNSLKGKYIDIEVIKTEYFGFKEIEVKTYTDSVVIQTVLELDVNKSPSARNSTEYHKTASGKRVTVTALDGQTKVIEFKPLTQQPDDGVNRAADDSRDSVIRVMVVVLSGVLLSFVL